MFFDENFLVGRNIENAILYVKKILTVSCGVLASFSFSLSTRNP